MVVSGSLTDGVEVRLDPSTSTEEIKVGTFVTIEGERLRFFGVVTDIALDATDRDIIGDPFHVRSLKRHGATTRPEALAVSEKHGFLAWHEPAFQEQVVEHIRSVVESAGRQFGIGPEGFGWLADPSPP